MKYKIFGNVGSREFGPVVVEATGNEDGTVTIPKTNLIVDVSIDGRVELKKPLMPWFQKNAFEVLAHGKADSNEPPITHGLIRKVIVYVSKDESNPS